MICYMCKEESKVTCDVCGEDICEHCTINPNDFIISKPTKYTNLCIDCYEDICDMEI